MPAYADEREPIEDAEHHVRPPFIVSVSAMTAAQSVVYRRGGPSLAWPLLLISLGVVFLLANAGYVSGDVWLHLAQVWPIALVLIGVDLLIRPRSIAVALIAEIALVAAAIAYAVAAPAVLPGTAAIAANITRDGASQLDLELTYGAGDLLVTGGATDLVNVGSTRQDVELTRSGPSVILRSTNATFPFGLDRKWNVQLPSDLPTTLKADLGAGDFTLDLGTVALTRATVTLGASDLKVTLPHPKGHVSIRITGGASSMTVDVPSGVEYAVAVDGGLTSTTGPTRSAGYATATDRVSITISAGASSIEIRRGESQ